jgi:hypothetical protein
VRKITFPILRLEDLLNENLIKTKLNREFEEAVIFLSKIYGLLYERREHVRPEKRFVVTSSMSLKLAQDTYIPVFPQEVEDLRKLYPEVDEYLKTLDFVHEDFIKAVGVEALEWLGVRRVTLKELVEKFILKQISTENPPPKASDLLIATALVKKAGVKVPSEIWVLTRSGTVERSSRVWFPLEIFRGLEDVLELLDIKLLDIDSYIKYDPDVEGWTRFFSTVVKGLQLYQSYYGSCFIQSYVHELIDRIRSLLERESMDINVKLVGLLKRLCNLMPSDCLNKITPITVKLLTDEDKFTYSNQLYLHDDYMPEEKWSQWRSKGFPIGPFVSLKYIENPADPNEVIAWRGFFTRVLGVRERVENEVIEKFAEWFVSEKLKERGLSIVKCGGTCDLEVNYGENIICVEVKGSRKVLKELEIELRTERVKEFKERYWLIVVESIPNEPKAWLLKTPWN